MWIDEYCCPLNSYVLSVYIYITYISPLEWLFLMEAGRMWDRGIPCGYGFCSGSSDSCTDRGTSLCTQRIYWPSPHSVRDVGSSAKPSRKPSWSCHCCCRGRTRELCLNKGTSAYSSMNPQPLCLLLVKLHGKILVLKSSANPQPPCIETRHLKFPGCLCVLTPAFVELPLSRYSMQQVQTLNFPGWHQHLAHLAVCGEPLSR